MVDINKLVRKNVKLLIPYSCARDDFQGKEGIFMDANENPFGNLNRYPDPYQKELKSAICRIKGFPEETVFLGNGSDEIIDLCYRIFCNPGLDKALTFFPTYGMYEVSAAINDVKVMRIPLNEEFQIVLKDVITCLTDKSLKIIFICSPNNPTANSMNESDIEYIISNFNGIVVLDEAYIDFSDKPSLLKMIYRYSNLIVIQTFSKALGLAAVRIGMAFSNINIIHYFNKMKPPYNISTINQKEALQKIGNIEEYESQVKEIKKERERLSENLKQLSITVRVFPSDANFLLVKVKNAGYIYKTLVDKKIIVRNRSNVVQDCLRITIGTSFENDKLINELKQITI